MPEDISGVVLHLVRRVRTLGAYEDWLARPEGLPSLPELVTVRRPHPEHPDPAALTERLEVAATQAARVAHPRVVCCMGTLRPDGLTALQVLEPLIGLELESLLFSGVQGDLHSVLWAGTQLADALAHAHSLGAIHGSVTPAHIVAFADGAIRIDFGLARSAAKVPDALTDYVDARFQHPDLPLDVPPGPACDVYGISSVLYAWLAGQPYRTHPLGPTAPPLATVRPDLPLSLAEAIDLALSEPRAAALETLAETLNRIFFVELDGDEAKHGQDRIADIVTALMPSETRELVDPPPEASPTPRVEGTFTQQLAAREGPVTPRSLATADHAAPSRTPAVVAEGRDTLHIATDPDRPALSRSVDDALTPPTPTTSLQMNWFLAGLTSVMVLLVLMDYLDPR